MTRQEAEWARALTSVRSREAGSESRLFALVYEELRAIAHRKMGGERSGHILQTTALVNEAYLRMVGREKQDWEGRRHFLGAAAESMRRILVDQARSRDRLKRGGGWKRAPIDPASLAIERDPDLLALDDALENFAALDERKSLVVKLRYFVGLSIEEIAEVLQVSPRTVKEDWRIARLWLRREIEKGDTQA